MKNSAETVAQIFLSPGEFHFDTGPVHMRTIVGSCVAITLWHPVRKIGGMCHFMLPSRVRRSAELSGKYCDEAIELFVKHARAHNTAPADYELKLFGGGEMFPHHRHDVHFSDVARMNISAALGLAGNYDLDLIAQDMGSTGYRNIMFDLTNGHVWVRHTPIRTNLSDAREKNHRLAGR